MIALTLSLPTADGVPFLRLSFADRYFDCLRAVNTEYNVRTKENDENKMFAWHTPMRNETPSNDKVSYHCLAYEWHCPRQKQPIVGMIAVVAASSFFFALLPCDVNVNLWRKTNAGRDAVCVPAKIFLG